MIKFISTSIISLEFYKTSLKKSFIAISALPLLMSSMAWAQPDVVRLGNLKFAHYGAISYMKEIAPKYNIKIEERMFAKGIDIAPAIVAGQIDIAASAVDAAIAARAQNIPIYVIAGFAKGGARIVIGNNSSIKSVADFKGKKSGGCPWWCSGTSSSGRVG